jgi:hypothetical protein
MEENILTNNTNDIELICPIEFDILNKNDTNNKKSDTDNKKTDLLDVCEYFLSFVDVPPSKLLLTHKNEDEIEKIIGFKSRSERLKYIKSQCEKLKYTESQQNSKKDASNNNIPNLTGIDLYDDNEPKKEGLFDPRISTISPDIM